MSYSIFDNIIFSTGGETEGSEGADYIINLWGDDEIDANGGNDLILDLFWNDVVATGGSGYDVLSLGSGNDVAIYNVVDNQDNTGHSVLGTDYDVYFGGKGDDTLVIDLTGTGLSADDVALIESHFAAAPDGGVVDFRGLDLSLDLDLDIVAKAFENLTVISDAPANTPPAVADPIDDITVDEDSASFDMSLLTYFTDAQTLPEDLIYSVQQVSGPSGVVNAAIDNVTDLLSISLESDANGTVELELTASDGEFSASQTFSIEVNPVNDPFVLLDGPMVSENTPGVVVIEFSGMNISDPDDDTYTLELYRDGVATGQTAFIVGNDVAAFQDNTVQSMTEYDYSLLITEISQLGVEGTSQFTDDASIITM